MADQPFLLTTEHLTLEGRSRAGHETWFRIRELGIAFDIGRCPDAVVSMPHVFISHAHLDHAAGIPWYAAQRHLQRLGAARIHVPAEAAEDVRALMEVQRRLTGGTFEEVTIAGMPVGEEVRVGRRHVVRAHQASHRVAARAYELVELRHHLKDEFAGIDGDELARLRRERVAIEEERPHSLLFYTGDTDRGILETNEQLYRSEILLIECSFLMDGHQERAAKYRHIHLDDIADFAERFQNELVVLTHFSRRYSRDEVREIVRRRVPHVLRDRIRVALP